MINMISYYLTIVSTIIGSIAILAGLIWGTGWLIFQTVDMILRVKNLRKLFIKFVAEQRCKAIKTYTPNPEDTKFGANEQ